MSTSNKDIFSTVLTEQNSILRQFSFFEINISNKIIKNTLLIENK